MTLKKIIVGIFIAILVAVVILGSVLFILHEKTKPPVASPEFIADIEEISDCLIDPPTYWYHTVDVTGSMSAHVANEINLTYIYDLAWRSNISVDEIHELTRARIVEFDIQKNMPAENICAFLNDPAVSDYHVNIYVHVAN